MMGIGPKIKEARERMNFTQKELGEKVGVTASAITNYENGVSHPKEPILIKLMETLAVDANYLFSEYFEQQKMSATNDCDGLTEKECSVALAYRAATEDDRAVVDAVLRKYIEHKEKFMSEWAI